MRSGVGQFQFADIFPADYNRNGPVDACLHPSKLCGQQAFRTDIDHRHAGVAADLFDPAFPLKVEGFLFGKAANANRGANRQAT